MSRSNFPIPDTALTQHVAVLGKTGSGKTSTAKIIVEHVVAAGARVCVLDPLKSDWWGLTSSADGKRAGLPFHILGGPHGHVPLHASAGKAIAEIVANGSLPLSIIDMADFAPGGQAHFFTDFAPALLRRMKGMTYLVIEEAHLFAPKERSGIGKENMAIHWAKTLATAGRSKGIRLILATQRIQALHNALLGSCDTMIAHRLTAPADQDPVIKWLKANAEKDVTKKVAGSLASLKTGHGWLCAGEARVFELCQFPRIATYDNTATPTGDAVEAKVKTAPVDADKLRSIIGDAVKDAEANDPKQLKRQIAELQKQLKAKPAATIDQAAIDKAVATTTGHWLKHYRSLVDAVELVRNQLSAAGDTLAAAMEAVSNTDPSSISLPDSQASVSSSVVRTTPRRAAVAARETRTSPAGSDRSDGNTLPVGERAILAALIQFCNNPAFAEWLDRSQLTVLTGYKRSTRDAYIKRLREKGLVETGDGGRVRVTAGGVAALPDAETLPTGPELQEFWRDRLPVGEWAILEALIASYPESCSRQDVTEKTGYKRSTRDAYIKRLKAKLLVNSSTGGDVAAADSLFD